MDKPILTKNYRDDIKPIRQTSLSGLGITLCYKDLTISDDPLICDYYNCRCRCMFLYYFPDTYDPLKILCHNCGVKFDDSSNSSLEEYLHEKVAENTVVIIGFMNGWVIKFSKVKDDLEHRWIVSSDFRGTIHYNFNSFKSLFPFVMANPLYKSISFSRLEISPLAHDVDAFITDLKQLLEKYSKSPEDYGFDWSVRDFGLGEK